MPCVHEKLINALPFKQDCPFHEIGGGDGGEVIKCEKLRHAVFCGEAVLGNRSTPL